MGYFVVSMISMDLDKEHLDHVCGGHSDEHFGPCTSRWQCRGIVMNILECFDILTFSVRPFVPFDMFLKLMITFSQVYFCCFCYLIIDEHLLVLSMNICTVY